ncbi:MAG: hypothetical protein PVF05_05080 [Gemmatimonadales bacterium]|jgi:photosystem II stability/assembly factor-like uncharacterized protein
MTRPAESRAARLSLAIVALVAAGCGGYGGAGASGGAADTGSVEAGARPTPVLERQVSGTTALLQAVSPVSDTVAWVSGHQGTWARTLDGGRTWTAGRVRGADSLQFRDVHAASADEAWLLSAGPGELSRIYHTTDGGSSWTLQWTNPEPSGFYDCLDFWDRRFGLAYGDAVDGELRVLETSDGGKTWSLLGGDVLPDAQLEEGGFAASGTCVVTGANGRAWIATGNARLSRVLHTDDWGDSWTVADTPIPGGEGAGLFSVAFRDSLYGVVFGGDLSAAEPDGEQEEPVGPPARVAISRDGGASWDRAGQPSFAGAVFGGAWVPGPGSGAMVAVAPTGASWSADGGSTWMPLDSVAYWGLGFASNRAGWLVGPGGRITRIRFD